MPRLRLILMALLLGAAAPDPGTGPGPAVGSDTGWPVPRFVSLRSDQVNFRAGPGFQYPITWIYQRAGLPVEVIGEFKEWRQVLAPDGGTGWVHSATIRARRGFYITAPQAVLHASASPDSEASAYLDQGVSGTLLSCDGTATFCKVSEGSITGYLARADFWGTFPDETIK